MPRKLSCKLRLFHISKAKIRRTRISIPLPTLKFFSSYLDTSFWRREMKEFQMGEKSFFLFARLSRFTLNLFQLTFHHFFWRISRRDKQQTTQTFLKFLVKKIGNMVMNRKVFETSRCEVVRSYFLYVYKFCGFFEQHNWPFEHFNMFKIDLVQRRK